MEDLRKVFIELGFQCIQTYIQSGNVVFQTIENDVGILQANIHNAIYKIFGFDVPVMVFEFNQFKELLNQNPFLQDTDKEINHLHVTFLSAIPETNRMNKLDEIDCANDQFQLIENAVFLYCPNNYGKTKLSNNFIEKKLNVNATTRNWRTTQELIRIAQAILN